MPGMSGCELGGILGRDYPALPVLYMSGHPDDVLADYGALSFGDHMINKPLSITDLASRLRRILEAAHTSAGEPPSG
jgi:FixJ family two-component response regulator